MTDFGGFTKAATLLDAVDALTKANPRNLAGVRHEHEWMTVDDDSPCRWCEAIKGDGSLPWTSNPRKLSDAPLLDQLQSAVANNIGGNGGGKQARERTPLDVGAFQLYETIDGRLRAWLLDLGAKPGKNVTAREMLRSWYALWIGGVHDDSFDKHYQSILEGWEQQIRDRLDPPKRIEISAPCPACGKEYVNIGLKLADGRDDPNDVERVRVLNAVERENISESFVLCSACDKIWTGVPEMRQLRIWIDDKEEAKRKAAIA